MPSSHLILCRPLLLLPPVPPSIKVFSNESTHHMRWPKYWSFSFSIIPSKEIPGLISFRMDWLDFLAVQGTLKSLLQHHSSKASILRWSAFFIVQLSHPYMTTGKTIALTRWTLVDQVDTYIPSLWSLPPTSPQSTRLSSFCYKATVHKLSVLHVVMYMFNVTLSIHPTLSFPCCVYKYVLYICVCILALQTRLSVLVLKI